MGRARLGRVPQPQPPPSPAHHDVASLIDLPSLAEAGRRVPLVLAGLVLFGVGIALMVLADLGLAPWDVFHQGVSNRTGLPIGTVVILTGLVLLALFIPLRERIGLGTLLNAVVIGLVVDATLAVLDPPDAMALRVLCMVVGPVVIAVGSGLYLGGGLGPGPRDGLMTGIARRGHRIWAVRTGIEVTVLLAGIALGGSIGAGTLWFALGIGPLVHLVLPRLTFLPARPPRGGRGDRPVQPLPGNSAS